MMKKLRKFFDREQNLLIHIIATIVVITLSIIFNLNQLEWIFIIGAIGLVITSELINSAIELTVDIYTSKFHPLAKIAKDTAAAAVVISAFTAIVIGIYIFGPRLFELIR